MIEKVHVVTCDWCGNEEVSSLSRKKDVLESYAKRFYVYRFTRINPLADELFIKTYKPDKYLTFCCEECANEYFTENPHEVGHYTIVKEKKDE